MNILRRIVPSSTTSDRYIVTVVDDKPVGCTCKGFAFRQSCKHLLQVELRAELYEVVPPVAKPQHPTEETPSTADPAKPFFEKDMSEVEERLIRHVLAESAETAKKTTPQTRLGRIQAGFHVVKTNRE